jgi:hypothetical protein
MPFDGSGNFNRVMNWVSDALANIKIVATRHDSEDDNFASGLSNCITKDGQTQPTANIPMNGKKLVNLGAPTTATDAATRGYVDTADGLLAPKASPTFTGKVTLPAASAAGNGVNMPTGVAPTTPAHGDIWNTAVAWFTRITGVTYTLAMLEKAQSWAGDQQFAGRLTALGAAISANTRSGLSMLGDLTFAGGYNLGWNVYFDTVAASFKASITGWGAMFVTDTSTGIIAFYRSTASTVAGAAHTLSAWLTADPVNGITLAGPAGLLKYNAGNVLIDNIDRLGLSAGFGSTAVISDGTKTTGTYTPAIAGGNIRSIINGGAHTIAADASATTAYTAIVQITNNASAGAITQSGWSRAWDGDPLTTVNGAVFLLFITKIGASKIGTVLQVS